MACASVAAMQPEIYVLDEPSSNLDTASMDLLHDVLSKWKDQGKTIVIAEHRLRWLLDICDRVIVMEQGAIAHDYTMDQFFRLTPSVLENKGLRPLVLPLKTRHTGGHNPTAGPDSSDQSCLTLDNFRFSYAKNESVLDIGHMELAQGQVTALMLSVSLIIAPKTKRSLVLGQSGQTGKIIYCVTT